MAEPRFHVQIYTSRGLLTGRQKWRWRAVEGPRPGAWFGNKLANGGEAYANKQDMLETVWDLFGSSVPTFEVAR